MVKVKQDIASNLEVNFYTIKPIMELDQTELFS